MTKFYLIVFAFMIIPQVSGQAKLKKVAKLPSFIFETSGLVYYQNKYLITHNDAGNKSEIYVLDHKGKLVQTIDIKDTKNKDWEDLTQDESGRLFIGDFGNNENKRKECQIYILPPDFITKSKVKPKKITFSYEDQKKYPPKRSKMNYDCEAFVYIDEKLYLFTKSRAKPYTGEARIYELPAKKGNYEAKYVGSINLCKKGWRFCSVTGADYNPKTKQLALITYSDFYLISDFKIDKGWSGTIKSYRLPIIKQREAVCFKEKNCLFVTDEEKKGLGGGNLYTLHLKK